MANKVTNEDLLREVIRSKADGKMSDELAKLFIQLVEQYSTRTIFANYPYMDECKARALMQLSKSWSSFDPDRFSNAWAFYWTMMGCSFAYVHNSESRQRGIKKDYAESLDDGNTN